MVDKEEKIRQKIAQTQGRMEEDKRLLRIYGGQLSSAARATDRDRKIQMGAWVQSRAEAYYPGITEKMLDDFRSFYLVTDYHRSLFDLPPLPEEQRKIRLANIAASRKRKAKPPAVVNPGEATATRLDADDKPTDGGQ